MWLINFMSRDRIKGCDVLLRGDVVNPPNEIYETKRVFPYTFKIIDKMSYNKIIISQEGTIYFHTTKEEKLKKSNDNK